MEDIIMNKEQILEMSRQENKNKDLHEKEIENQYASIAGAAMAILSCIFFASEIIFNGRQNYGFYALIAVYDAILFFGKGIRLKQKTSIISGIIWGILAIGLILAYFYYLVKNSTIR